MIHSRLTFSLILIFFLCSSSVKADYSQISLAVGEKTTVYLPYDYTSKNGLAVWSNDNSEYISVVGDPWSVDITVKKYTSSTCRVRCIYSYKEDGWSYTKNYDIDVEIRKPDVTLYANPSGGRISKGGTVYLSCSKSDAEIYYTLDGNSPSEKSSRYSSSGIEINKTCTLKAIAVWEGFESSPISEDYIVDDLYVTANPKGGTIKKGTIVNLSCYDSSADIYYTLDGSTPTQSSTKYTSSGIEITEDCTLKAKAFKDGKSSEKYLTETYKLEIEPTKINIYLSQDFVALGGDAQAYYSLEPYDAVSEITWWSDDSSIASINNAGKIKGKKVGTTFIHAKTENGIIGDCEVKVKEIGVKFATAGGNHTLIVKDDGSLWACGRNENYQIFNNNTNSQHKLFNTGINNVVSISAGDNNSFYVDGSGSLRGRGDLRCIGLLEKTKYDSSIMNNVSSVDYDGLTIYFISKDGTLYGCGYNTSGQLGNGKIQPSFKPVEIMKDVMKVSTAGWSVHIIKKDGSLWACGGNSYGHLGDGTDKETYTPVKIMNDVKSIATGSFHTLIVKSDGSLWVCGSNSDGQLCGSGNCKVPVKVMEDVEEVAASSYSSFIIKKDHSLWVCGKNGYGQLGTGSTETVYFLQKIMDDVRSVSAGDNHTLIIKNGGSLWACGNNQSGQLGDGTTINRTTPKMIIEGGISEGKLDNVLINGLVYNLDLSSKEAEITGYEKENVNSTINIPDYVEYNNVQEIKVTKICESAFRYCDILKRVDLPNTLKEIGDYAFANCTSLTSVVIPQSVEEIADDAFHGCSNLQEVKVLSKTPITAVSESAFSGSNYESQCVLRVPKGTTSEYKQASVWKDFKYIEEEKDDETEPITIGKSGKASYCGDKSLDFGYSDELKAYIATGFDKDEGTIWLTRVKDVPAGVPVLIKGEANKTYDVPVTDSQNSYYTNMFVGNTSGEKMVIQERDGDMVNYYLSGDGTFKSVNKTANIGTNKCYLQLPGTFEAAATGATQTVKVGSIGKASYAAPVDLDFTNVSGLKAFTATGYDKSTKTIWLTRVMKVQKGEGVLLKGNEGDYQIPSMAVQSSYMNMFVGNTSGDKIQVQETSADGSMTNFYLKGDGTFVSVNGYVNINNNKCYLELPTSMVAVSSTRSAEDSYKFEEPEVIKLPIEFKSIGGDDEDGTTSIKELTPALSEGEGEWYTLQGQRVAKPGKGVYIRNGKKVVIK